MVCTFVNCFLPSVILFIIKEWNKIVDREMVVVQIRFFDIIREDLKKGRGKFV